jgi:hypothetical protein
VTLSQCSTVMCQPSAVMRYHFLLIHIDADDDDILSRMMMLSMKKTSDDS